MATKKYGKKKQNILNTIPIFLSKTYVMIDNPQHSEIISWSANGQGFVIRDIAKLTTDILPKHFKHNNFASFVRQLNMYGFKKIRSQGNEHVFQHEFFKKDKIQLLSEIKRKSSSVANNLGIREEEPVDSNTMIAVANQNKQLCDQVAPKSREIELQKEISNLVHKHTDLQNIVSLLIEQNKEIIMQNRKFVLKLNKMDDSYTKKLETLIWLMLFGRQKTDQQGFAISPNAQKMLQVFRQAEQPSDYQALELFKGNKKNKKQVVDQMVTKILRKQSENSISQPMEPDYSFESIMRRIDSGKEDKLPISIQNSVHENVEMSDDEFMPALSGNIPPSPIISQMSEKNQLNELLQKFNNQQNSQFSLSR